MGRGRFPGRGQGGRGHGRGPGRGSGRGRQNDRSGGTTQANKKEYKFAIQVHGSTTAYATYTSVKEALTRNIQRSTYKIGFEFADRLETMKVYDWDAVAPQRPISTIQDEDQRKVHQEGVS